MLKEKETYFRPDKTSTSIHNKTKTVTLSHTNVTHLSDFSPDRTANLSYPSLRASYSRSEVLHS